MDLIGRAGADARRVVDGIGDDAWHRPTPCTEYDVHRLLEHFVTSLEGIPAMAGGERPDWERRVELGSDPAATFAAAIERNHAYWAQGDHAAAEMMPGLRLVDLNLTEMVVHGWDLAKATGQDPAFDADAVEQAWAWATSVPSEMRSGGTSFGPPVEVPSAAPTLDRLVGLLGRTP